MNSPSHSPEITRPGKSPSPGLVILCCPPPSQAGDSEHFIIPNGLLWIASSLEDSGIRTILLPPAAYLEVFEILAAERSGNRRDAIGPEPLSDGSGRDDDSSGIRAPTVILGITLLSSNRLEAWNLLGEVRNRFPDTVIIAGGPQVSADPGNASRCWTMADHLISGPGHVALPDAALRIFAGGNPGPPRLIDGWAGARDPSGKFKWPTPPVVHGHSYENVVTSLGCPGRCSYCSTGTLWPGKVLFRDPLEVATEIEGLWSMGIRRLVFSDDTFTADPARLRLLFETLESRGVRISWDARTRADAVSAEDLDFMRAHGCCSLSVGIESADPGVLEGLGKKLDPPAALEAVKAASKVGIYTNLFFIIGGPGESKKSIDSDIAFIEASRPGGITTHLLHFLPGTALEGKYGRRDWYDFSSYTRTFHFTVEHDMGTLEAWRDELEQAGQRFAGGPRRDKLKELVAKYPDQFDLWALFGDEAFESGRFADARARYEKAESLNPTPEVKFKMAMTLVSLGKGREARKWRTSCAEQLDFLLSRGLRWNEKSFFLRSLVREELGRPQEAVADLEQSLRINPWYTPALENMSYKMLDISNDFKATEYLNMIEKRQRNADWYYNYTICMLNIEEVKKAKNCISEGVESFPDDPGLKTLAREIRKSFGK